jgi:hypothetical protein
VLGTGSVLLLGGTCEVDARGRGFCSVGVDGLRSCGSTGGGDGGLKGAEYGVAVEGVRGVVLAGGVASVGDVVLNS